MDDELLALEALPYECLVEIFGHLETAADLCTIALTSSTFREVSDADFLWRGLCVKGQHGQSLDFQNYLGSFGHPDAKPIGEREEISAAAASSSSSSSLPLALQCRWWWRHPL